MYIAGCTDPTATNYDPLASIDDGSCTYGCAGNALTLEHERLMRVMDGMEMYGICMTYQVML